MRSTEKLRSARRTRRIRAALIYLFLTIVSVIVLFPVLYTILGSFKTNLELRGYGNHLIPRVWVLENYKEAWEKAHFAKHTWNSLYMSAAIVFGSVFSTTITGYVFEKGKFRGKNVLWMIIVYLIFNRYFISGLTAGAVKG